MKINFRGCFFHVYFQEGKVMDEPYILKIDTRKFYCSLLNLWTMPEGIMFRQRNGKLPRLGIPLNSLNLPDSRSRKKSPAADAGQENKRKEGIKYVESVWIAHPR